MLSDAFPTLMRALLLALIPALAVAGCTSNAEEALEPLVSRTEPPALPAVELEGTIWLPPSMGQEPERTEVPFNASAGQAIEADVRLGASYGVELPFGTAEVTAQLETPEGEVVDEVVLHAPSPLSGSLAAEVASTGEWKLVILSYGGSDGKQYGDHVEYSVRSQ